MKILICLLCAFLLGSSASAQYLTADDLLKIVMMADLNQVNKMVSTKGFHLSASQNLDYRRRTIFTSNKSFIIENNPNDFGNMLLVVNDRVDKQMDFTKSLSYLSLKKVQFQEIKQRFVDLGFYQVENVDFDDDPYEHVTSRLTHRMRSKEYPKIKVICEINFYEKKNNKWTGYSISLNNIK